MKTEQKQIFVEKKSEFGIYPQKLLSEIKEYLNDSSICRVRVVYSYIVTGIDTELFNIACSSIFSQPNLDNTFTEQEFKHIVNNCSFYIAREYLPGQFDQRSDAAEQCIKILNPSSEANVKCSTYFLFYGDNVPLSIKQDITSILINPVDSRQVQECNYSEVFLSGDSKEIAVLSGFRYLNEESAVEFIKCYSMAMNSKDLLFCCDYFRDEEKRDPTITELRILDTYWSDHCRHTTFLTNIKDVIFEDGVNPNPAKISYDKLIKLRNTLHRDSKPLTLMEIATIAVKKLKKEGKLEDLDESDEINACSFVVDVDVDGRKEKYLLQFKNETHNHPTEIEPFGGAATCIGGAIRDPLSGRAYVYQAMRLTGSGDPRKSMCETMQGKLPQRKITKEAADGYSSYGNQIGLATGLVSEIYHEGYIAKRMEVGAVIGAVPLDSVVRQKPEKGDIVILLGGKTGRDGCGGATGSSKSHDDKSIEKCGSEVQKGNAPEERKIQRFFRNHNVLRLIKKCNDFGAGGVSVAVGELADGIDIFLDNIPKKYDNLNGTELAISESQERMAVVVSSADMERFISLATAENLEAVKVADITDLNRVRMFWQGSKIVDLSRAFLNSNGVQRETQVLVESPPVLPQSTREDSSFENNLKAVLASLNVCSKQGLAEQFDSTIGCISVLFPYGGKYKKTPCDAMVAKVPVLKGDTDTCSIMSYGFNVETSEWSPYWGALNSVIESVSKIIAAGAEINTIKMSFQEYFERLGDDPKRWGKPFSALLGAFEAQIGLGLAAIGGKDSMSGSFKNMDVPPALISFAVGTGNTKSVISPEFKKAGNRVYIFKIIETFDSIPDFDKIKNDYVTISRLIKEKKIVSASTVSYGGIASTVAKMCFGNRMGFTFDTSFLNDRLFAGYSGSIIVEVDAALKLDNAVQLGVLTDSLRITAGIESVNIDDLLTAWEKPLENVFPIRKDKPSRPLEENLFYSKSRNRRSTSTAKPTVFIPVFPGTNCEYDSEKAFERVGAKVNSKVFRNYKSSLINDSISEFATAISNSQIIFFPGGFSAGDEPEGSGKFIANIIRNSKITDVIHDLLYNRDGLILGICNGFQALIKTNLLPYGKISEVGPESPTLTFNNTGRHISDIVTTKIISDLSPWLANCNPGDIHSVPISHGEGRFVIADSVYNDLRANGQIATQYCTNDGVVSKSPLFNPNGSYYSVEGITSPDGRIFGKMGHSERIGNDLYKNLNGIAAMDQKLFKSGVEYFS